MGLVDKFRFHFNLRVRPLINTDQKRLFRLAKEDFPFAAVSHSEHLLRAIEWWRVSHAAVGGKGFPTKFNVLHSFGLGPSYPETTGYTLNTLLTLLRNRPFDFDERVVVQMLRQSFDWLLEIQFENGAWTGGHAALHNYGRPSIFNTGQILLGMVDCLECFRERSVPMDGFEDIDLDLLEDRCRKAAYFLRDEMEANGAFATTHDYIGKPLTYYARSMYGALRTGIVLGDAALLDAIRPHYNWVLSKQENSGWINDWGFEPEWAVMHRIAYTLRGMVEAAICFGDDRYFNLVKKGIDFLLKIDKKGFRYPNLIPSYVSREGKFRNEICPTGLSQLAIVIAKLPDVHLKEEYRMLFTHIVDESKCFQTHGFKNALMNGVLPGSYPLEGKYKSYDLLEWATKFFTDSVLIQMGVPASEIKG